MSKEEVDEFSGTKTTGHDWGGIKELDTPMPRWWLMGFWAGVIWAFGYMAIYLFYPMITGSTKGYFGYSSSRAEFAQSMVEVKKSQEKFLARINEKSLKEIRADKELVEFAYAGGKSAFAINCSQCHGSGAAGAPGYPNLNDDNWLWGGSMEEIFTTISHGIRFDQDEDTRLSEMPGFGRDEILDRKQINQVADFVLSLSNRKNNAENAKEGAVIYAENCAACHGAKGEGDREQGAPQLNNVLWLYGNKKSDIIKQVTSPKHGVMPAWDGRLSSVTIKQLTVYVHSLGGGE